MRVVRTAWIIPFVAAGFLVHCVADDPAVTGGSGDGGTDSEASDGGVSGDGSASDTGSLVDGGGGDSADAAASCIVRAADAAPPGSEDSTFAGGVKSAISMKPAGMAVDQQGRIYVTGYAINACSGGSPAADLILARFTRAGEVDTSFHTTGQVCIDYAAGVGNADQGLAVGVDSNNQPVVVGIVNDDGYPGDETAGIMRFTEAGALDTSFHATGKLQLSGPSGGPVLLSRVPFAIAFDGTKIVVAGSNAKESSGNSTGFVWEVNHDGTPASAFGTQGVVTDATVNGFYSVAVSGGAVFVGGAKGSKFLIRKYTSAGAPDSTFNGGDIVTNVSSVDDQVRAIAVQANGLPVAAGASSLADAGGFGNLTVLRGSNAGLDPAFGTAGYYKAPALRFPVDLAFASALAIQCDGKILVAGTMLAANQDMSVARLLPNGQVDTTFGTNGITELTIAGDDVAVGLGIDPMSNNIVVLGRDISASPVLYRFIP